MTWARRQLKTTKSRKDFEGDLVAFQRHFLGGLQKDVEAVATGGGTRSINVAFETVLRSLRRAWPPSSSRAIPTWPSNELKGARLRADAAGG